MLLDSLERLAKTDSAHHDIYAELVAYFNRRRDWRLLDLTTIGRDLPLLDAFALAGAVDAGVKAGQLRPQYTVLTPDGVISAELFPDPKEIPPILYDRFDEPFETRNYPLVAVFESTSENSIDAQEGHRPFRSGEAGE